MRSTLGHSLNSVNVHLITCYLRLALSSVNWIHFDVADFKELESLICRFIAFIATAVFLSHSINSLDNWLSIPRYRNFDAHLDSDWIDFQINALSDQFLRLIPTVCSELQ
jgi:hypothetical protein